MKMLLITNEKSGKGKIRYELTDIMIHFIRAGYQVDLCPIAPGKSSAAQKISSIDPGSYDKVVIAGGDGTMSRMIQLFMKQDKHPVIGYIPAGSTNDFAKSLGIPSTAAGACHVILTGREFAYDIGCFDQTWFNYVAAFGAFVPVSFQTDQRAKNALGHGAYILEGISTFQENISFSCGMEVTWDNEEHATGSSPAVVHKAAGDFVFGAFYNASSIGGIHLPGASLEHLQDGEFELLLIRKPRTREDRHKILSDLTSGILNTEFIVTAHAKHIHFHAEHPILWTLDGEDGGVHQDVEMGVAKHAMTIMVPKADHV